VCWDGRRFQADGAATEKELLESWRLNRGTIKSPRDVDRSRVCLLSLARDWRCTLRQANGHVSVVD